MQRQRSNGLHREDRNGQHLHVHGEARKSKSPPDWRRLSQKYANCDAAAATRRELAHRIGGRSSALQKLGCGWDGRCWTFPLKNPDGKVLGILCRSRGGALQLVTGGCNGLVFPEGWNQSKGPILVVDNPVDAAVLLSRRITAVACSFTKLSAKRLAALFHDVQRRRIIVLSKANQTQDGSRAVRDKSQLFAERLATELQRPVALALPPDQAKILREWTKKVSHRGKRLVKDLVLQFVKPSHTRRTVVITDDEYGINSAVIEALANDETIYTRGELLVHVLQDEDDDDQIRRPEGAFRIRKLSGAVLRERISRVVEFMKAGKDGLEAAHPPAWCVSATMGRGNWEPLRELVGISTAPILRPDGSVANRSGYDRRTRMLVHLDQQFDIPKNPDHAAAIAARDLLLELVSDFPFEHEHHKGAWLAFLLTLLSRQCFRGTAPLFLFDANTPGAGKTLLTDLASLIVTGKEFSRMANPSNDTEFGKIITSLVNSGDSFVLIDNVVGGLGSPSLDNALTGTAWLGRILKSSKMANRPLDITWAATGNNLIVKHETSRRVCRIRLQSPLERPEERDDMTIRDIRTHVCEHRPELLSAALTILRAYHIAGCPAGNLAPWGSFEEWSALVCGCVVWLGLPDPAETRHGIAVAGDPELDALREVLIGWDEVDPQQAGLTTSQLLKQLLDQPKKFNRLRAGVQDLCDTKNGSLPTAHALGNKLKSYRGRVVDGMVLDYREKGGRKRVWRVSTPKSE